ncbi:MAG TPA: M56 family metallopeptidase [Longimicrobium sp.]|nr:M56 family metallopeptidase [Longimicrobium sp.]
MIASWMMYSLLVGTLVAAAGWTLEEVCRLTRLPVRWVWIAALATTLGMLAIAPLRPAPPRIALPAATVAPAAESAPERDGGMLARIAGAADEARTALDRSLGAAVSLAGGVPGVALAGGWAALSLALIAIGGATLRRARRERGGWPLHEMDGTPVRVAPGVGPAVLGVRAPEVVVPRWLLEAPEDEQRLVVMHEREHIAARDPLVLAMGCVAAALVPWNPAAWWMLRRLRQATELDCDARVLRRGVHRGAYGSLLIDMAGRGPGLALGAPALAGSPSSLQRRLRAMNVRLPRFARARAGFLGVLGAMVLVGACQADMPTSADVDRMDASAAQAQAARFHMIDADNVTFEVDGKAATSAEAHAIPANRIAEVQVRRKPDGSGTISITTGENTDGMRAHEIMTGTQGDAAHSVRFRVRHDSSGVHAAHGALMGAHSFDGLVIIDGRVVESSALRGLNPSRIATIDVIKGSAATSQYSDPRASKGVLRIITKTANR